jgi:hypothetical protein
VIDGTATMKRDYPIIGALVEADDDFLYVAARILAAHVRAVHRSFLEGAQYTVREDVYSTLTEAASRLLPNPNVSK